MNLMRTSFGIIMCWARQRGTRIRVTGLAGCVLNSTPPFQPPPKLSIRINARIHAIPCIPHSVSSQWGNLHCNVSPRWSLTACPQTPSPPWSARLPSEDLSTFVLASPAHLLVGWPTPLHRTPPSYGPSPSPVLSGPPACRESTADDPQPRASPPLLQPPASLPHLRRQRHPPSRRALTRAQRQASPAAGRALRRLPLLLKAKTQSPHGSRTTRARGTASARRRPSMTRRPLLLLQSRQIKISQATPRSRRLTQVPRCRCFSIDRSPRACSRRPRTFLVCFRRFPRCSTSSLGTSSSGPIRPPLG